MNRYIHISGLSRLGTAVAVLALAVVLAACQNPFARTPVANADGMGILILTMQGDNALVLSARSINPTPKTVARYSILLSRSGYSNVVRDSSSGTVAPLELATGTWTLVVRAYDALGQLVAESVPEQLSLTSAHTSDSPLAHTVNLNPPAVGTGRLRVSYDWSTVKDLVDKAEFKLTTFDYRFASSNYTTLPLPTSAYTINLAAGTASFDMALAPNTAANPYVVVLILAKHTGGTDEVPTYTEYPPVERAAHIAGGYLSAETIPIIRLTGVPEAPENLSASMPIADSMTVRLGWEAGSSIHEGFKVYRNGTGPAIATITNGLTETWDDAAYSISGTQSYTVTAYNRYGESNPVTLTIVNMTSVSINDTEVTLDETGEHQLDIDYGPEDATFKELDWDVTDGSGNPATNVTVTDGGLVQGSSPGTVRVKGKGRQDPTKETGEVSVTVPSGAVNITISVENPALPTYGLMLNSQALVALPDLNKAASTPESFTLVASSTLDSYQWFLDDAPISGATTNSITINSATLDVGVHWLSLEVFYGGRPEPYRINESFRVTNVTEAVSQLGTVAGQVREIDLTSGLAGVTVTFTVGSTAASAVTGNDGSYTIQLPGGTAVSPLVATAVFSKTGYLSTSYIAIPVVSGSTAQLEAVELIPTPATPTGGISGTITDAFTGQPVEGLMVKLREGVNNTSGSYVQSGDPATDISDITDALGNYELTGLDAGDYTAELSKEGYIPAHVTVKVKGGGTTRPDQNSAASPQLATGEIRIVLTWGAQSEDLDIWVTLPDSTRIWWDNFGSAAASPHVLLDRDTFTDDVLGYGPETVTIHPAASAGTYTVQVCDYYNWAVRYKDLPEVDATYYATYQKPLSASGAKLQVYMNLDGTQRSAGPYNVPNLEGDLWKAFTIDKATGAVTVINTMGLALEDLAAVQ